MRDLFPAPSATYIAPHNLRLMFGKDRDFETLQRKKRNLIASSGKFQSLKASPSAAPSARKETSENGGPVMVVGGEDIEVHMLEVDDGGWVTFARAENGGRVVVGLRWGLLPVAT